MAVGLQEEGLTDLDGLAQKGALSTVVSSIYIKERTFDNGQ